MSKFSTVLISALVGPLALTSTSQAKPVSKYCKLISGTAIGRPLKLRSVRTSSVSLGYPVQKKGDKGRITLCSHTIPTDTIAQTSVSVFNNSKSARTEFVALVNAERKSGTATKMSGPWSAAYYMGMDGFVALKGRYMFHIEYASGIPGYANVTPKVLAGLSATAVRKL